MTYKDISKVMDVSKWLVSRIKRYYEERPEKVFRDPGRPSIVGDVFGQIKTFIQTEIDEERSVTISILLAYLSDVLRVYVSRKNLREFMRNHGYPYVSAVPTEEARVNVDRENSSDFTRHGSQLLSNESTPPSSSTWTRWVQNGTLTENGSRCLYRRDSTVGMGWRLESRERCTGAHW